MATLYVNQGEAVLIRVAFTLPDGQPMAATGVTIKARRPDGTVVDCAVAPGNGPGRFEARVVADVPGAWRTIAECSGPEPAIDENRFTVNRRRFTEP